MEIPYNIAIQSHLSDALFELETQNEELRNQAANRISFVKNLILQSGGDLTKSTSDDALNKIWTTVTKKTPGQYGSQNESMTETLGTDDAFIRQLLSQFKKELDSYDDFTQKNILNDLLLDYSEAEGKMDDKAEYILDCKIFLAEMAIAYRNLKLPPLQKKSALSKEHVRVHDIEAVAKDLRMSVTPENIQYVRDNYSDESKHNPNANWRKVVETLLNECAEQTNNKGLKR